VRSIGGIVAGVAVGMPSEELVRLKMIAARLHWAYAFARATRHGSSS
jgi:hypothetical protein